MRLHSAAGGGRRGGLGGMRMTAHTVPVCLGRVLGAFAFVGQIVWVATLVQRCHLSKLRDEDDDMRLNALVQNSDAGRVHWYLAAGCQVSQYESLVSWSTHRPNPGQRCCLLLPAAFGRGWHHDHVGGTISFFFVCDKTGETIHAG